MTSPSSRSLPHKQQRKTPEPSSKSPHRQQRKTPENMSNAIDLYDTSACYDTEKQKTEKPKRVWRPVDVPNPVCPCGLDIELEKIVMAAGDAAGLTPKEKLILLYVCKGLSTKEMSDALGNTEKHSSTTSRRCSTSCMCVVVRS